MSPTGVKWSGRWQREAVVASDTLRERVGACATRNRCECAPRWGGGVGLTASVERVMVDTKRSPGPDTGALTVQYHPCTVVGH